MDLPSWQTLIHDDFERTLTAAEHGSRAEALAALDRLHAIIPFKTAVNGNEHGVDEPLSPDEMHQIFVQKILPIMEQDLASFDADEWACPEFVPLL